MATSKNPTPDGNPEVQKIHQHPPLIHLGKLKSNKSKKLKKGRGPAMDKMHQAVQQVKNTVGGGDDHHPVVISYEEKPKKKGKKKNINLLGLKINRKKLKKRMKKSGIRHNML